MLNILFWILIKGLTSTPVEGGGCVMYPRECGGDWGLGAYYLPAEYRLNIYDDTLGKVMGTAETFDSNFKLYGLKGSVDIEYCDIEFIGSYSLDFLKVKDCESSRFLKVLEHTYEGGKYVRVEELDSIEAVFYKYSELVFKNNIPDFAPTLTTIPALGVNLNRSCLNLREEPDVKAKLVVCVPGNDWAQGESIEYSEMTILKHEGNWAFVEVTFNDLIHIKPDGCMGKEKRKLKGWVKAIADNGFPNIWYPVSGY